MNDSCDTRNSANAPHLLTLTDFQLSFYISDCTGKRALEVFLFDRAVSIQASELHKR